jgi:hypothetical protein
MNRGKRWVQKDIEYIKNKMKDKNYNISEVADYLGRTNRSIECQMNSIIYNYKVSGMDIDKIVELTPYNSIEYINDIINNFLFRLEEKRYYKKENDKKRLTNSNSTNEINYIKQDIILMKENILSLKEDMVIIKNNFNDLKYITKYIAKMVEEITVED